MFSFIHLLPLFLSLSLAAAFRPTFNVLSYGAQTRRRFTDNPMFFSYAASTSAGNSAAFTRAWNTACASTAGGTVLIPSGSFVLGAVQFAGPCKGPVHFLIKGILEASDNSADMFADNWITFSRVDQLVVTGGGSLHGHGSSAWSHNDCDSNPDRCKLLPFTMRFEDVSNSKVNYIQSVDSRGGHFDLYRCQNVEMSNILIKAPSWSPNTDGIHMGASSQIGIYDSNIMTGDDCVSMVSGTHDVDIQRVQCGPGHGFSIGSLGKYNNEEPVRGISIGDSSLRGTKNGLRIKTWASPKPNLASDIIFHNIVMDNVEKPIIIDQHYCPNCKSGEAQSNAQSNVQIRNVTFSEVHGTSSSRFAVQLLCSKNLPCEDIKLNNINLAYHGRDGPVASSCINVEGKAYGVELPSGCL